MLILGNLTVLGIIGTFALIGMASSRLPCHSNADDQNNRRLKEKRAGSGREKSADQCWSFFFRPTHIFDRPSLTESLEETK